MSSTTELAKYGIAGAIGLLITMWAIQAYFWYGYQQANPDIGTVSTTAGFEIVVGGLFVLGVTIAFTAFARGSAVARNTI